VGQKPLPHQAKKAFDASHSGQKTVSRHARPKICLRKSQVSVGSLALDESAAYRMSWNPKAQVFDKAAASCHVLTTQKEFCHRGWLRNGKNGRKQNV
jgi:hypothetical protein